MKISALNASVYTMMICGLILSLQNGINNLVSILYLLGLISTIVMSGITRKNNNEH